MDVDSDVASDFAAIRMRARRKRLRRAYRTTPACAVWVVVWVGLIAMRISWLLAAFPAGFVGAAIYRTMEQRFPESED